MGKSIFSALFIILVGSGAAASFSSEQNQALLEQLRAQKTATLWTCKKGENPEAVLMFKVNNSVSALISGHTALAIEDKEVCSTLGVTCPFIARVSEGGFGFMGPVTYSYWSTRGKYEDTVMFFSDSAGMKLVSVTNGSNPSPNWNENWFFPEGSCIRR